jgi:hypothetical protein
MVVVDGEEVVVVRKVEKVDSGVEVICGCDCCWLEDLSES